MFWKSKKPASVEICGHVLYEGLAKALTRNGRIHVEDLISAAAAIVGEAVIDASGDFNPRSHNFTPGSRVLSQKANELICGDKDLEGAPENSIAGILRAKLTGCGFTREDFPVLEDVFRYYAANIGRQEEWGKVPLSIPADNNPFIMPLRAAYEARPLVDQAFAALKDNRVQRLNASVITLVEALCKTRDVLPRKVAVTLAFETVNGMAKTAPMTDAAMKQVQAEQGKTVNG